MEINIFLETLKSTSLKNQEHKPRSSEALEVIAGMNRGEPPT
jgi:hypothetical protein